MNNFNQEEIIKLAAAEGAKAGIEKYKSEQNKAKRKQNDRRLKNAKLLLQNYRDFKSYSENAKYTAEQAEDAIDILDLMWDPNNRSDLVIESIKASAVRTKIIMAHIDGMLNTYKELCERSTDPIQYRRYAILFDRYISDEQPTMDEIANKFHIDKRTAYLDLDTATQRVAKLVFGIDYITERNG